MHPIQDLFLESFHIYYNLICIFLYALLFAQNFILVKKWVLQFFKLWWAQCSFHKNCGWTRYAEVVFSHQVLSTGHVVNSGVSGV
jgi:hypothetical protein